MSPVVGPPLSTDAIEIWQDEVVSNLEKAEIKLEWKGIENIPADHTIFLVDQDGTRHDMRVSPGMSYISEQANETRRFQVVATRISTGVMSNNKLEAPGEFALLQNYPNPFNPETVIAYHLPETSEVSLAIYSVEGKLIRELSRGQRDAGKYQVVWDGRDESGNQVASGVYLYHLQAGTYSAIRKLTFIK